MTNYVRMGGRKLGKAEKSQLVAILKADKEFMDGIRRGVKDCKEGRRWSEIKRELNL